MTAEAELAALTELIGTVRTLRSEYGVPPARRVDVWLTSLASPLRRALDAEARAIQRLARVEQIVITSDAGEAGAHAVLSGGTELLMPLADVIDLQKERLRLDRELVGLGSRLQEAERKLENQEFIRKAPAEVVARAHERARLLRDQRERLASKLAALR